jgi:hypothetical protein
MKMHENIFGGKGRDVNSVIKGLKDEAISRKG